MGDFTKFDTTASAKRKRGYDAFDAPPPSAVSMNFDDEFGADPMDDSALNTSTNNEEAAAAEPDVPMTEEERKIQEEIEELERQSRLTKLKKELEAKRQRAADAPEGFTDHLQSKTPSGPSMASGSSPSQAKTPAATTPGAGLDKMTPRTHKTAKVLSHIACVHHLNRRL